MNKLNHKLTGVFIMIMPLLYAFAGFFLIRVIVKSGTWPGGSDVMYHIYRGEKVLQALQEGHIWIPVDYNWYNGVEILRYWSPLPAYLMAFSQWIGGSAMNGYLVFTWLIYFLSALSWYLIGIHQKRPIAGSIIGLIWFFTPMNVLLYFENGNLAGMCGIAVFLPLMISAVYDYLQENNQKNLWKLALVTMINALCHSGFALLDMLVIVLWILLKKLFNHDLKNGRSAVVVMILGFLLTGVWFLASRFGVSSVNYDAQLASSFQNLSHTLNPLDRSSSHFAYYYFGLSIFLIALLGTFASEKDSRAGFLCTCIICLLTSKAAYEVIRVLPGGSFLWTYRMVPCALAIFFFSLLSWNTSKKWFQMIAVTAVILDFIPSLPLIYGNQNGASLASRFDDEQRETLLTEAKKITQQRIALIDASSLGSTGAYLASSWHGDTDTVFGAGYEAAVTRKNITMLNRAANDGAYDYLFDRAMELGADTVDIEIAQLQNQANDFDALDNAAVRRGYTLIDHNDGYALYHLDVPGTFGIVSQYRAIAIGSNASEIAEYFPAFQEADETDLSNFTFDDLKDYALIYLDGFTMSDKDAAEDLIIRLSENGTKVIVAADGVPEERSTRNREFLGVTCNPIRFENGYPEMNTDIGILNMELFPATERIWNTVYLTGLDHASGTIEDNDLTLEFAGTVKNDNITFIGLNLSYFYALTKDPQAEAFLSEMMQTTTDELPERRTVNITIQETDDGISIQAGEDHVNTTLAYHDIYTNDQDIVSEHNLLYVNTGTTVIKYHNTYILPGLIISLVSLIILKFMAKHLKDHAK